MAASGNPTFVAADCVKSKTGCEWAGWGCQPASGLTCVNNNANTGCDVSLSEVGCWWQSGYCTDNSKCQSLTSSQAVCEADSKMCEWYSWTYGGCSHTCGGSSNNGCGDFCVYVPPTSYCESVDAYCQTKVDGSGCTPKSNLTMCSLTPAITAESCVVNEDLNEECLEEGLEGNSCSADALSWGCVSTNSNAAFNVQTSSLLVLVAMLSLLLF